MSEKIEFRVQGPNSSQVAAEFAKKLKTQFDVDPVVQQDSSSSGDGRGEKFDPALPFVILHAAIVGFDAYKVFVVDPRKEKRDELVRKWEILIEWAKSKLPTTIRAVIGAQTLLLHESLGVKLHDLTKKALDEATVVTEH